MPLRFKMTQPSPTKDKWAIASIIAAVIAIVLLFWSITRPVALLFFGISVTASFATRRT